jgi:hypothetical protein
MGVSASGRVGGYRSQPRGRVLVGSALRADRDTAAVSENDPAEERTAFRQVSKLTCLLGSRTFSGTIRESEHDYRQKFCLLGYYAAMFVSCS